MPKSARRVVISVAHSPHEPSIRISLQAASVHPPHSFQRHTNLKRNDLSARLLVAACLVATGLGRLASIDSCAADVASPAKSTVDPSRRGVGAPSPFAPPTYELKVAQAWQLQTADGSQFDASGLLRLPDQTLLTVNDRAALAYRIVFRPGTNVADLVAAPEWFSTNGLATPTTRHAKAYDAEGLARDDRGRIYLCEESRRQIHRFDPSRSVCETLDIDWKPVSRYFDGSDSNASFEGIAIGHSTLYVANERQVGRIITVDLATLRVTGDFSVAPHDRPARDVHYSDLCWFDEDLWVLCRESRRVLRVNPTTHAVRSEFDYADIELSREYAYYNPYPGYGFYEGLSVDAENIWLAVDNNNYPRIADKNDRRPSLFRCRRPDK